MQLVAYGAQDVYLTGNPQITFFKVVYRRHTNFSMESIEQTFDGSADYGRRVSCTISRNGDLISNMYLQCKPAGNAGKDHLGPAGYNLINSATLEIGGQQIDKHYGHWMNVWSMLSTPAGQVRNLNMLTNGETTGNTGSTKNTNMLYIPFQFWFCRNPGLALPLIALQYHEVKLVVELATHTNVADAEGWASSPSLFVDYIYLDTDERRRFAQVSHEYLIEQLQFTGDETASANAKFNLNFNHPVKELIWAPFLDTKNGVEPLDDRCTSVRLMLNGHDRFSERDGTYFTNVQPLQHHTSCPMTLADRGGNGDAGGGGAADAGLGPAVHVYSFALKPEEHQPSGTCNMSRIDTAVLSMDCNAQTGAQMRIYAVNYNVLRIMSGMGGLAYSN